MHRVVVMACALTLFAASQRAGAQALVPHQLHRSATIELHSVHDNVQLYEGDPQLLLRLDVRPQRSQLPRIDFSNTNQVLLLRIHDLDVFEPAVLDSARMAENFELGIEEDLDERRTVIQDWKVELAPSGPTDFFLRCEGGNNLLDFTDLPVQSVYLIADSATVRVDFNRPNQTPLTRFRLTGRASRVDIRGFGNARSRSTTLQIDASQCELDLSGKLGDGAFEVFVEGVPEQMRVTLPRRIGLRIDGPAATIGQFDRDGMVISGTALEDGDYAQRPTRLALYFSRPVPKLEVRWKDSN